ncbi:hypothetical protein BG000_009157 [Podila horticola]|nr:hypothetical protein BG000_009157 [Podila horticola]
MAEKRSRNDQPNQLVPLAIKPATRSAAPPHAASPTPGPQSEAASDGYQGLKASLFWVQEGIVMILTGSPIRTTTSDCTRKTQYLDQKPKDIRQKITNVVNNKHKTKCTKVQVQSKIAYIKTKYREAAQLNSGHGAQVSTKQLQIYPEFTRLHDVYGRSPSANPLPPKQTSEPVNKRQRGDGASAPAVFATYLEKTQ